MDWKEYILSLNEVATTFKTTLAAAVGKVKSYYFPLHVLNVSIHIYPAPFLMQAK